MPAHRHARILGVAACLSLFAPVAKADPIVFTNQHIDIDLRFEGRALEIGWHDETNGVEYAAGEALVPIPPGAIVLRPAGSQFNFLGFGAGQPVRVLPQINNPALVWLGFGSEEIDPADFTGDLTVELVAVRGPGAASSWATDALGNPQVLFASGDGITGADSFLVPTGSHQHFNFAFTAAGLYELDFRVSGTLASTGQFIQSDATTLVFEAQQFEAVPAPASALVLIALLPLLAVRVRHHN
jgi:surface-anchored protein